MTRAPDDTLDKARLAEANGMYATARVLYRRARDTAGAKRCAAKLKPQRKSR
jgi:hypothetical protein